MLAVDLTENSEEAGRKPELAVRAAGGVYPGIGLLVPSVGVGNQVEATYAEFTDLDGREDMAVVHILFANRLDGRNACFLSYFPDTKQYGLLHDQGNAYTFVKEGDGTVLENSQCSVKTRPAFGPTTKWNITLDGVAFKPGFGGNRLVYTNVQDRQGVLSGWSLRGMWMAPGNNLAPRVADYVRDDDYTRRRAAIWFRTSMPMGRVTSGKCMGC